MPCRLPSLRAHGWLAALLLHLALDAGCAAAGARSAEPSPAAAVREALDRGEARGVAQLLAATPPSFRARHVLLVSGGSPQRATPAAPRAIVYGDDATFVLAFNGGPRVDTMEFDRPAARFVLREILFPADGEGSPTVSEDNPGRCLGCHGSPPRPLWDRTVATEATGRVPTGGPYEALVRARVSSAELQQQAYEGHFVAPGGAELAARLTALQAEASARAVVESDAFDAYAYAVLGTTLPACRGAALVPDDLRPAFVEAFGDLVPTPSPPLAAAIVRLALERDPSLRRPYEVVVASSDCRDFARRSSSHLAASGGPARGTAPPGHDESLLGARCGACHGAQSAHPLRFAEPAVAARAIERLVQRPGRAPMPPGAALSSRERAALVARLRAIATGGR